mmetsp:Transcript_565/g.1183  ORF Transcript_565/g.1183 Transcript_565/m.1183 type:complete len:206 (-) Transcript_565:67-684(-)
MMSTMSQRYCYIPRTRNLLHVMSSPDRQRGLGPLPPQFHWCHRPASNSFDCPFRRLAFRGVTAPGSRRFPSSRCAYRLLHPRNANAGANLRFLADRCGRSSRLPRGLLEKTLPLPRPRLLLAREPDPRREPASYRPLGNKMPLRACQRLVFAVGAVACSSLSRMMFVATKSCLPSCCVPRQSPALYRQQTCSPDSPAISCSLLDS